MKVNIIILSFGLLFPGIACSEKCEYTIPLRIDKSFSKLEKSNIERASKRWHGASDKRICFSFKESIIYPEERVMYREDWEYTIYNGFLEWQKKVADMISDCGMIDSGCSAVTIKGIEEEIETSDIFIISKYNFLNLVTHELGHLLGLAHSDNEKDIMFPWVKKLTSEDIISKDDISKLKCLMDSNKLLHWETSCNFI